MLRLPCHVDACHRDSGDHASYPPLTERDNQPEYILIAMSDEIVNR